MRLINTDTLQLEEFMGVVPKYAILSHTWGDEEVSLQDWEVAQRHGLLRSLNERVMAGQDIDSEARSLSSAASSPTTSPPGSPTLAPVSNHDSKTAIGWRSSQGVRFGYWKILRACAQARSDSLRYLWADTNCIDKTSSAELSEAINSMYGWYGAAATCYAYLVDVPRPASPSEKPPSLGSRFRASRWFTRGWTLQELIAPKKVTFFSCEWRPLGTKESLAGAVSAVTRIDANYLLLREGIQGASVAQRMSWAADRITTRPEDIAYCLLGIFDVNMPLIYGEGAKAFVRLQEAIVALSDDHSIFAWSWVPELSDPLMRGNRNANALAAKERKQHVKDGKDQSDGPADTQTPTRYRPANFPSTRLTALRANNLWKLPSRSTLLAPDPLNFYDAGALPFMQPHEDAAAPFTITNAGLAVSLPLIRHVDDEMFLAVLHSVEDSDRDWVRRSRTAATNGDAKQSEWAESQARAKPRQQTLICIPLVQHSRHRHRFTRTWFPGGPVTIVRPADPERRLDPTETVQVCRDVQHVPFYYPGFGGAWHRYGFWLMFPRGGHRWKKRLRFTGGYASPNGVFNSYGIFVNPTVRNGDVERGADGEGQLLGGILLFESCDDEGRGRDQAAQVVVVGLTVEVVTDEACPDKDKAVSYHCEVVVQAKSIFSTPGQQRRAYFAMCQRHRHGKRTSESAVTGYRIRLLNDAPMSHAPGAKIRMTEITFT